MKSLFVPVSNARPMRPPILLSWVLLIVTTLWAFPVWIEAIAWIVVGFMWLAYVCDVADRGEKNS